MSNPGFPSFGTDAIHAGQDPEKFNFKSAVPPITMASTYQRSDTGIPDLTNGKYIYSRLMINQQLSPLKIFIDSATQLENAWNSVSLN